MSLLLIPLIILGAFVGFVGGSILLALLMAITEAIANFFSGE